MLTATVTNIIISFIFNLAKEFYDRRLRSLSLRFIVLSV